MKESRNPYKHKPWPIIMTEMKRIFSESKKLRAIIESHKWTLYDVSKQLRSRENAPKRLDDRTPAEQYEIGHNYFFVPILKQGQTVTEACSITRGLGPSLKIENVNDERWESLDVQPKAQGYIALFTNLFMHQDYAILTAPELDGFPDPDFVAIKYNRLVDTFRRYFRIVSPIEYGLPEQVPMPFIPRNN